MSTLADREDVQTLARKLIDNAVKFNKTNGIVKIQLVKLDDMSVRLDVIDNGIGIAPEDIPKIKEPFVQLDEGFTRSVDGTGLGLAVADRISSRLRAKLEVRSAYGQGTVASVVFNTLHETHSQTSQSEREVA